MSRLDRIDQQEVAHLLGVTRQTVRVWSGENPPIPRGANAKYDAASVVEWFVDRELRRAAGDDVEQTLRAAKSRKELAIARRREIEVEILEGKLIDVEEAEQDIARELAAIRAGLLSFAGILAPRLARYRVEEAIAIVEPAVHELMHRLAEGDAEDSDL